jgi:hypothetical protein
MDDPDGYFGERVAARYDDISRAMIARLRAKPGSETAGVTIGDFATTRVRERWDSWTRSPFTSDSRQHVSIWEKPVG